MTTVLNTALEAYKLGLCVLPVREDGSKAPDVTSWTGYQKKRPSPEHMKMWFRERRRGGLGLLCGHISGDLELFEFDDGDTFNAFLELASVGGLADLVWGIAEGYEERTPGGGIHWLYRCPAVETSKELANRPLPHAEDGTPRYKTLIETRGEGGFVVIAPSNGRVHETGGRYELISGGLSQIIEITPEERAALFGLARSFDEMPKTEYQARERVTTESDGDRPGDRFNVTGPSWHDLLEPRGWQFAYRHGDKECWRRPGKNVGISATINGPGVGPDRLYVWTSSTEFESRRSYSKYQAYAVLEHGGDFAAAASTLARKGYRGTQSRDLNLIYRKAAGDEPPVYSANDAGNAERLVYRHGENLRYNWGRGIWHVWNERYWEPDDSGRLDQLAKDTANAIPDERVGVEDDEKRKGLLNWSRTSLAAGRLASMVKLARSEPGIPIQPEQLDANAWLLNVANGTLNLQGGTLQDHARDDYLTRGLEVQYNPKATCERFDAFLDTIMGGDAEMIEYVWRLLGYSLTGSIREQIVVICYGTGSNGKSTLLTTIRDMLGEYARDADADSFMEQRAGAIREDIADLDGARFVAAAETRSGQRLSEALIKKMTGGERLRARRLYENGYEFQPQFKIWLSTNHKPTIQGTEHAIWRRIRLIPFVVTIPKGDQDPDLTLKLQSERPGILARAVRGCLDWQRDGLPTPAAVEEATSEYQREMDVVGAWLDDCCRLNEQATTQAKQAYESYVRWAESSGEKVMTQSQLGQRLKERGFISDRTKRFRFWMGFEVLSESDEPNLRYSGDAGA